MFFLTIVFVALAATSYADKEENKVHAKRGAAVGYTAPTSRPSYVTGSPGPSLDVPYKLSQAAAIQKPTSYSAPQVQYVARPVLKYNPAFAYTAGQQEEGQEQEQEQQFDKAAYAQQQSVQQFSPAADVSSFSYSSPNVKYNSQGYFQQVIGKVPAVPQPSYETQFQAAPQKVQSFAAAPQKIASFVAAPQKISSFAAAPLQYTPGPKFAYAAAPVQAGQDYTSGSNVQYITAPQQFAGFAGAPQQAFAAHPYAIGLKQAGVQQGYEGYAAQLQGAHSQSAYAIQRPFGSFSRYNPSVSYSH